MSGVYGGGNWKDRVNRDDWKGGWQERRSFGRGRKCKKMNTTSEGRVILMEWVILRGSLLF